MRKTFILLFTSAVFSTVGCHFDGSQSISVHRNNGHFRFQAEFASKKSPRILGYIERQLPMIEFDRSPVSDGTYSSSDTMKFHMKTRRGFVQINFDAKENSRASVQKLERICTEIKNDLGK